MITLRQEIAHEAGFPSFTEYAYRTRERFDYGVTEATAFQDAIAKVVVPLARQIQEERRKALGVASLRPWDLSVDPARPGATPAVRRGRQARRRGARPSSATWTPNSAPSSPTCGKKACSTWRTARARPPAVIRPLLKPTACRSSS